ncbi:MAG: RNA polymerase sigma factor, partial [Bryobacteraceae bacterium]
MAQTPALETAGLAVRDFEGFMAAEQQRIYLLCLRLLRDPEDAGAATQDAFFKAYRAIEHGAGEPLADPAKWITRIAVNTCLDRLRSRRWQFWRRRP